MEHMRSIWEHGKPAPFWQVSSESFQEQKWCFGHNESTNMTRLSNCSIVWKVFILKLLNDGPKNHPNAAPLISKTLGKQIQRIRILYTWPSTTKGNWMASIYDPIRGSISISKKSVKFQLQITKWQFQLAQKIVAPTYPKLFFYIHDSFNKNW